MMKFKILAVTIFASILPLVQILGQSFNPNNIIPPTPTTAALGAFGNYTVGYHTGRPSVVIPIYSIKSHDNNLDISLIYDASGIRVAQDASWVGLGWSLMAGGLISKTIRGYDDFKDNGGYYKSPALPPSIDQNTFIEIDNGRLDVEPDLYSYNFGPYSGKFVLGKQMDGSKVFIDERNNLKIEYNGTWTITDPKGFRYKFEMAESASNYTYSSEGGQVSKVNDLSPFTFQSLATTGWVLTSILSPKNDEIIFNYTRRQSLSIINMSETQYDRNNKLADCLFRAPYSQAEEDFLTTYRYYNASRQRNSELYLQSIVFSNGSIEFETTDRKDIDYLDATQKPAKLTNLVIYNTAHQKVKSYSFDYAYFKDQNGTSNNTEYLRLKLISLTENSATGTPKPPYKFNYYSDNDLPSKYSKDIDHWGFYNGALNSRLLPMPSSLIPPNYFATGDANRDPDITNNYAKAASLISITYPTGGHTDYEYELNEYGHLSASEASTEQAVGYLVSANDYNRFDYRNISFDVLPEDVDPITKIVRVTVVYRYSYVSGTKILEGVSTDFGNFSAGVTFMNDLTIDPKGNGAAKTIYLQIGPGHYTMNVRYIQGYSVSANVFFNKKVTVSQKKGGGIRVSKIIDYDEIGTGTIKKYLYTNADGSSSGRLLSAPVYGYKCPPLQFSGMPDCDPSSMYICRMSSSVYSSGISTQGNIVGYDKVTELIGINGENGKTEYYFSNIGNSYPPFPGAPIVHSAFNGKLINQSSYDANGRLLRRELNTYKLKNTVALNGILVYKGPPIPRTLTYPAIGTNPGFTINNGNPYSVYYYANSSNWIIKDSTITTSYSYDGSNMQSMSITTANYFDNADHMELTRSYTNTSKGGLKTTIFNYPGDYSSGTNFIDQMKARNIIAVPIEQVTYETLANGTTVSTGHITEFKEGGTGLVSQLLAFRPFPKKNLSEFKFSNSAMGQLPSEAGRLSYTPDTRYRPTLAVNNYDSYGNPLSVTPTDGIPTIYVWGYQKHYPIAKVLNSTLQNVINILGGESAVEAFANTSPTDDQVRIFLAPLRTHSTLFVETYTYKPLVGKTSFTDTKGNTTYYEYDDFQRLLNIKDVNGDIQKNFKYNYSGQRSPAVIPGATFGNATFTYYYTRNNCGSSYSGTNVPYTVNAGQFTANTQQEADLLAFNFASANGQINANDNGGCILLNPITPYVKMQSTGGYLGSDNHYYGTFRFELYTDAAFNIPYTTNANYSVPYRLVKTTSTSSGSTTTTSIKNIIILAGTNAKSIVIDVNTCGNANSSMQAKTSSSASTTNAVPGDGGGGGTPCSVTSISLVEQVTEQ